MTMTTTIRSVSRLIQLHRSSSCAARRAASLSSVRQTGGGVRPLASLPEDEDNENHGDTARTPNSTLSHQQPPHAAQRVWKATASIIGPSDKRNNDTRQDAHPEDVWDYWEDSVVMNTTTTNSEAGNTNSSSNTSLDELLHKIGSQEEKGGRMRQSQLGVLREDPSEDMRLLMENYTVPALATALRDREDVLQQAATLVQDERYEALAKLLQPYQRDYVLQRRTAETLNLSEGFTDTSLEQVRKSLMRMPRRVTQAHQKRAGVVVALANVHQVPSVLLEKRSPHLRAHPDEVCLPGGMMCSVSDPTIVATCLREMKEEIEGLPGDSSVLGVLRCNWGEVHHLVGVAVTPLVCFVGELGEAQLQPNPSEVSEVFTIPLADFLDRSKWIHREGLAPIFTGGPHPIWGLTGYIMERFAKDILARYDVIWPDSS